MTKRTIKSLEKFLEEDGMLSDCTVATQVNARDLTLHELRMTGVPDDYLFSINLGLKSEQIIRDSRHNYYSATFLSRRFNNKLDDALGLAHSAGPGISLSLSYLLPVVDKSGTDLYSRNFEQTVKIIAATVEGKVVKQNTSVDDKDKRAGEFFYYSNAYIGMPQQVTQSGVADIIEKLALRFKEAKVLNVNYYGVPVKVLRDSTLPRARTIVQNNAIFI